MTKSLLSGRHGDLAETEDINSAITAISNIILNIFTTFHHCFLVYDWELCGYSKKHYEFPRGTF